MIHHHGETRTYRHHLLRAHDSGNYVRTPRAGTGRKPACRRGRTAVSGESVRERRTRPALTITELNQRVEWLPGGPAVTLTAEAITAIHRTVSAWHEGQTRLVSTGAASGNVHLARTATTAVRSATAGPAAVGTAVIAVGTATAIGSTASGGTACATATVATPCPVTAATTATRTCTLLTAC